MKISTTSWHYYLVEKYFKGDVSENLCSYFWQVVFVLISLPVISGGMTLFSCMVISLLTSPLTMWVFDSEFLAVLGIMMTVAYIYGLSLFLGKRISDRMDDCSFTMVAINTIAAKKDKVCPSIEFVDKKAGE